MRVKNRVILCSNDLRRKEGEDRERERGHGEKDWLSPIEREGEGELGDFLDIERETKEKKM